MDPERELRVLRVSVARIAQVLDLDDMIPGAVSTERLGFPEHLRVAGVTAKEAL